VELRAGPLSRRTFAWQQQHGADFTVFLSLRESTYDILWMRPLA
jgi:hypothetical protein